MAAASKHYGDVKKWIEQVIDSCETYQQLNRAERLIDNFEKYLIDYVNPEYARDLIRDLYIYANLKYSKVIYNLTN
jgi:hypothetical protein